MAYVFQTFVASQVLTAAQMNQVEENIKAHVHGLDGVVAAGLSFTIETLSGNDTVAASDIGKFFYCSGAPYDIDFVSAATLGDGFAAGFKNIDSLSPIYLAPFGSQTMNATSGYLLCPNESVIVVSDGANLFTQGEHDAVRLFEMSLPSSYASTTIDQIAQYVNHFRAFDFQVLNVEPTGGTPQMRFRTSVDSGSTYLTSYDVNGVNFSYVQTMDTNITTTNRHIATDVRFWPGGDSTNAGFQIQTTKRNDILLVNNVVVNSNGVVSAFQIYTANNGLVGGSLVMYGRGRM